MSWRAPYWWQVEAPVCPEHGPCERTGDMAKFICRGCDEAESLNLPREEYPPGDPRLTKQLREIEKRIR